MLSGAHLALAPAVVEGLRAEELEIPVLVGGIVPDQDVPVLLDAGVAAVVGPGASADELVAAVHAAIT
jgi:methylmalonyl-CoA mutase C-terminal domain/subunit